MGLRSGGSPGMGQREMPENDFILVQSVNSVRRVESEKAV